MAKTPTPTRAPRKTQTSAEQPTETPGARKAKSNDLAIPKAGSSGRLPANTAAFGETNRGPVTQGQSSPGVTYGATTVPSGFGRKGQQAVQGLRSTTMTDERTSDRPYHTPPVEPEVDKDSGLNREELEQRREEQGIQSNEPKPLNEQEGGVDEDDDNED